MGRIRTIKPELPQSESMGRVSRDARLLFIQLWTLCDDEGRTRASSRMLASLLYPYDDGEDGHVKTTAKDVERWLAELEREGCIVCYHADETSYLQIAKWLNHQKIDHAGKSKIPAPPQGSLILARAREHAGGDQGPRTKDQGKDQTLVASATSEPVQPELLLIDAEEKQEPPDNPHVAKTKDDIDPNFLRAWERYPDRYGGNSRHDALKAWTAQVRSGTAPDEMIAGVERYAAHCKANGKTGTSYVKMAATFFGPAKHFTEDWPAQPPPGGSMAGRPTAASKHSGFANKDYHAGINDDGSF